MKKIFYSTALKLIAVILFVVSIMLGSLTFVKGFSDYYNDDDFVYSFESDFSESWYISNLLNEPALRMLSVYHIAIPESEYDINGNPVIKEADAEKVKGVIKQWFNDFDAADKINYFVQWNDMVVTNCGAQMAGELAESDNYMYFERYDNGRIVFESSQPYNRMNYLYGFEAYNDKSTIVIECNIKEEVINNFKTIWEKQERLVIDTVARIAVCIVVALLTLIYLLCVCGKDKNGEYKNMWLDNIWLEVHLAAIGGSGVGAVMLCWFLLEEYLTDYFPLNLLNLAVGAAAALGSSVIISSLLSVIRNIKTRRLMKTSVILIVLKWLFSVSFKMLRWLFRIIVKFTKWVGKKTKLYWSALFRLLSKKSGVLLIGALLIYTAVMGVLCAGVVFDPFWLILCVLVFGGACFAVALRSKDFDEIKKGVSQVRGGNVAYKISDLKCSDMKNLAVDINDIAKGLDEAVAAKVNAERLKSELITNVSHDLKTPITSIISYTQLLSKVDGLPEEAKDYVSVIAKKSDRLKRLTQDLFDISKAQSGNDAAVMEKLDVALLINQALGEHDSEIQRSGLPFCIDTPKDMFIYADGRKMSRVLGNLINNILKYTMKNTRVFISASEKDGNVEIEFKNISAYPLNFNTEEITQRFIRGDESRTAEGNGLGLAIAKSYTELCGGSFDVVIDGDMFKAIIKFQKHN